MEVRAFDASWSLARDAVVRIVLWHFIGLLSFIHDSTLHIDALRLLDLATSFHTYEGAVPMQLALLYSAITRWNFPLTPKSPVIKHAQGELKHYHNPFLTP